MNHNLKRRIARRLTVSEGKMGTLERPRRGRLAGGWSTARFIALLLLVLVGTWVGAAEPENAAAAADTPRCDFWTAHWEWWLGGLGMLVASTFSALAASWLYLDHSRRSAKRSLEIFRGLPVRIGVVDPNENLLFLSCGDAVAAQTAPPQKLVDLPDMDYEKLSRAVRTVFADGQPITLDYECGNRRCALRLALLPAGTFPCRAAVWIAHDNSTLQETRDRAEALVAENRKYVHELSDANNLWNAVIDSAPFFFFVKDAENEFRYLLCNSAFAGVAGHTVAEVLGRTDAELFPLADDVEQFQRADARAMEQRHIEFTEEVTGADNKRYYINTVKKVLYRNDGRPLLVGISNDITQLKLASENERTIRFCLEKLMTSDDIDQAIHDTLGEICNHLHASRTYFFQYNDGMMRFSHEFTAPHAEPYLQDVPPQPLTSPAPWFDIISSAQGINCPDLDAEEPRRHFAAWRDLIQTHKIRSLYAAGIFINGKLWGNLGVLYEVKPCNLSDYHINFIRSAAHLFELVIERRTNRDALLTALEQARSATRAKSVFLANMSHELRTPLNAVIGFSELLAQSEPSVSEAQGYVSGIHLAGKSLLALINDILELSKIEADRLQIVPGRLAVAKLLEELDAVFSKSAEAKGVRLHMECPDNLPELMLDELRLRQILMNLLGNAIKFTPAGTVTLSAAFRDGVLTLTVADTGIGIEPAAQARIFEPFTQQNAIRDSHVYKGTGLGLAIASKLAERMNGVISLQSEPGRGSTFTVRLNAVAVAPAQSAAIAAPSAVSEAPQLRVLVVDDVEMNLKVLGTMLRKLGANVVSADSAAAALARLREQPYDLVMTDIWMPGMNGAELAEEIRRTPQWADAILFAVTADSETHGNFRMDLFDGVLLKPVSLEKLRTLFQQIANGEGRHVKRPPTV